jgi:hypothetical protein
LVLLYSVGLKGIGILGGNSNGAWITGGSGGEKEGGGGRIGR